MATSLAATVVVFGFSRGADNSSVYDPYWSVAPIAIVAYWFATTPGGAPSLRAVMILTLVTAWGLRLTHNFLRHWSGLGHEDWRYADFRVTAGRLYWPVSFLGFHLFPTLIVFAGCVPIHSALHAPRGLGLLDGLAVLVTAGAIVIESTADAQLRAHVRKRSDHRSTFRGGLWAYSRHPNYFGEVLFWWGLFLFALAADPQLYWTVFGPLGVTALFATVSLPLIERRMLQRRADHERVRAEVSILIPWFPRRPADPEARVR